MDIEQLKKLEPIFGSWYVDREIGTGSFGKVYSVYKDDSGIRFWAALKTISIPTNENEIQELDDQGFDFNGKVRYFDDIAAGITGEIRIMNSLRGNSNIVCFEDHQTIMHSDGIGRDIMIRMELLQRLDEYMKSIHATQYDVVCMLRDIAQALVVCDKRNIIHRDIKPDNIMVSENGDYKLVDFGIARNMEKTSQASTKAGSYPYMAPEVQMHQPYGKTVDIYSLGIVAYREFNAYRYPFLPPYPQAFTAEQRDQALVRRFRGEKLPPIPGLSKQVFSIIEKCTALRPDHRYSSAMELLKDLQGVINLPELKKKPIIDADGNLVVPGGKPAGGKGREAASAGGDNGKKRQRNISGSQVSQLGGSQMSQLGGSQVSQLGGSQVSHLGGSQVSHLGGSQVSQLGGSRVSQPGGSQVSQLGGSQVSQLGGSQVSQLGGSRISYLEGRDAGSVKGGKSGKKKSSAGKKIALTVAGILLVSSASLAFLVVRDQGGIDKILKGGEQTEIVTQTPAIPADNPSPGYNPHADRIRISCEQLRGGYLNGGVKDERIIFTGHAEGGAKLVAEAQNNYGRIIVRDELDADPDGNWSWVVPQSLFEDDETITVKARYADDEMSASEPVEFKVDRLCVSIALNEDVTADTVKVAGVTEPGATVTMTVGGEPKATEAADNISGEFSLRVSGLEAGADYEIRATDRAGNESEPYAGRVGPESRVKVEISHSEGIINDYLTDHVRLSGSARPQRKLALYIGDEPVQFVDSAANGSFSVEADLSGYVEEKLILSVRYADGIGEASDPIEGTHIRPLQVTVNYEGSAVQSGDTLGGGKLSVRLQRKTDLKVTAELLGDQTYQKKDFVNGAVQFNLDECMDRERIILRVSYEDFDDSAYRVDANYLIDRFSPVPRIDPTNVTEDTVRITGSGAEPNSEVFLQVDGEITDQKTADDRGGFAFDNLSLQVGQDVKIWAEDPLHNISEPVEISVKRGTLNPIKMTLVPAPTRVKGTNYLSQATASIRLTGEARKNTELAVSLNGVPVEPPVWTDDSGKWECELNIEDMREGDQIHIRAAYAEQPEENAQDVVFTLDTKCAVSFADPVSEDKKIDFTADPFAEVTVTVDGKIAGTGKAGADGAGSIAVPPLAGGATVRLEAKDEAGNTGYDIKTVYDPAAEKITIDCAQLHNGYLNGSAGNAVLTGQAMGGRKLIVSAGDGKGGLIDETVPVSPERSWTWTVPGSFMEDGDTITVEAHYADDEQKAAEPLVFEVDLRCLPIEMDKDNVTADSTAVTGKTEAGATVTMTIGGEPAETVVADDTGRFSIPVKGLKAGTDFEIRATDRAGNAAKPFYGEVGQESRVKVEVSPVSGIINDAFMTDHVRLSGTARPERKLALYINDKQVKEFDSSANGEFTVEADLSGYAEEKLTLSVRYADGVGEKSDDIQGTHILPLRAVVKYGDGTVKSGDTLGTGTLSIRLENETGLPVKAELSCNGIENRQNKDFKDGSVRFELTGFDNGEQIDLRVFYAGVDDIAYRIEASYLIDSYTPTPVTDQKDLTEDTDRITGSGAEPEAEVILEVDGDIRDRKSADADGRFAFDGLSLKAGQRVTIRAKDKYGNISDEVTLNVRAWKPIECEGVEPQLKNEFLNGDADALTIFGVSEANRKLEYRLNGEKIREATPADGSWQWTLPTEGLQPDGKYTMQVQYAGQPDSACAFGFTYDPVCAEIILDAQSVDSDTEKITGKAEPKAALVLRDSAGGQVKTEMVREDGSFSITLSAAQREPGTVLTLQAEDMAGNKSEEVTIVVLKADRKPITVDGGLFPISLDADTFLVSHAPNPMVFMGTAQAGKELKITYTVEREGKTTSRTSKVKADANGEWKISLPLGSDWDTAVIRADYALGDYQEMGRQITVRQDNECKLYALEERLVENNTELTVYSEQGAMLQLYVNGSLRDTKTAVGSDPVKFGLSGLRPGDRVDIAASDPLKNKNLLTFIVEEEERPDPTIELVSGTGIVGPNETEFRFRGTAMPNRSLRISLTTRGTDGTGYVIGDITTDENGEWSRSVSIAELKLNKETEETITFKVGYADRERYFDGGEFLLDRMVTPFILDGTPIDEDTTFISGQAENGAGITLIKPDGKEYHGRTVGGRFTISGITGLNAGDQLRIVAKDQAGNTEEKILTVAPVQRKMITMEIDGLIQGRMKPGMLSASGTMQVGRNVVVRVYADGKLADESTLSSAGGKWSYSKNLVRDGVRYTVEVSYADGKSASSSATMEFMGDGKCQEISGLPRTVKDTDSEISGVTEAGAEVRLTVNSRRTVTVKANENGSFVFRPLNLNFEDVITIQATDILGNVSEKKSYKVDTSKKRITDDDKKALSSPSASRTNPYEKELIVTFHVFSLEEQTFYFTLSSDQGYCKYNLDVSGEDIHTGSEALNDAGSYGMDTNEYVIRYGYEVQRHIPIGDLKFVETGKQLPDGEYTFSLFAEAKSSGDVVKIGDSVTVRLKGQKTVKTDYVNEYQSFALGLDPPASDTVSGSEIVMTGWIWAPQNYDLGTLGVKIFVDRDTKLGYEENEGYFTCDRVSRSLAEDHPEYEAKYGKQNVSQGGITVRIQLGGGGLTLKPGKHKIKLCFYELSNPDQTYTFGTYEFTVTSDR